MTSFNIRANISENEKLLQRQNLLQSLRSIDTNAIFQLNFEPQIVGKKNIENLIGSVGIPLAIAGPVKINCSLFDPDEELLIPLCTTEGALVASVSRGFKVINLCSAQVSVEKIGMTRAPAFELPSKPEAIKFAKWLKDNIEQISQIAQQTSDHLKLLNIETWVRENFVFARFVFDTDEAMGMNMVTIGLQHLFDAYISHKTKAQLITISSNVCTDKKQSTLNLKLGRGYSTTAEIEIDEINLNQILRVTADQLLKLHYVKNILGSQIAGSTYRNMHVANAVAAILTATGQDIAHVVELSQANLEITKTKKGVRLTLKMPDMPIGVIGGGNQLPAQQTCKNLIRKNGRLTSNQLAAVIALTSLAGEISGMASLAASSLASAHQRLGRINEN